MGGRGSSSGITAAPVPVMPQPTSPMGKTLAEVQAMDDDQLHDFLIDVQKVDTPDFLNTHHTQKMVYGLGLNDTPQVVPDAQLQTLIKQGAKPIYRSVDGAITAGKVAFSGQDMLDQLRYGDLTYLGDGRIGDGLYFSSSLSGSKLYGKTTVQGVLSPSAKVISRQQLNNEYNQFIKSHPRSRKALGFSSKHGSSWHNSLSQFALIRGYNVISEYQYGGETYYNVIDRSALIVSDKNI